MNIRLPRFKRNENGFVENNAIWTLVGVLAIVALLLWIFSNLK